MTFEEMKELEPRLAGMEAEIKRLDGSDPYFCANFAWGLRFKPQVVRLVGWDARDERLAGSDTYNVAYRALYGLLPGCQRCSCLRPENLGISR